MTNKNLREKERLILSYSKKVRAGETWTINDKLTRGHKSTITGVVDGVVKHVPRSHSPVTRGMRNIPLQENPQRSDKKRKAYIIPKVQKTNIKHVGKKQENQDIKNPIDKSVIRHLKKQNRKRKQK